MADGPHRRRPESRQALVLGAGISGLAAAHRLTRDGWTVAVLEAAERPGGTLRTAHRDGFRFELGPNTVLRSAELEALCAHAGCADRLRAPAPAAGRRFLVSSGELVALPGRPPEVLRTPLLSWPARLRLLTEPLRRRGPGPEETVAAFVRRRFGAGPEVADLADAMVTGVYAGDPEELAVGYAFPRMYGLEREHGSLLRGLRRAREAETGTAAARSRLVGFEGGFGALAAALATRLDIRCGTAVASLAATARAFRVEAADAEGPRVFEAERVVVALPAAETARVLAPLGPPATALAAAIDVLPHAPVAVIGLGYARAAVGHPLDGFGFLVPAREGRRILGCLFVSTLFPDAAPGGCVTLAAMVGGGRRPELVEGDDEALIALASAELAPLLDLTGAPRAAVVARWQPGIPQPTPAAGAVRRAAADLVAAHPGLEVLGGWLRGVGVPDCVRTGWRGVDSAERSP